MSKSLLSIYSEESSIPGNKPSGLIEVNSLTSWQSNGLDIPQINYSENCESREHHKITLQIDDREDLEVIPDDLMKLLIYEPKSIVSIVEYPGQLMAEKCLEVINKVVLSMTTNTYTQITDDIIMLKDVWNVDFYVTNELDFPLDGVPIKCNILNTLAKLLQDYRRRQETINMEHVTKVLQYLNKLLLASNLNNGAAQIKSIFSVHTSNAFTTPNLNSTIGFNDTQSISSLSTTVSSCSTKKKSHIFGKLLSRSKVNTKESQQKVGISSNQMRNQTMQIIRKVDPISPVTPTDQSSQKHVSFFKKQDIDAMVQYKILVSQLSVELSQLPYSSQNDIIFSFVNKSINPLLLQDCKLLLIDYLNVSFIERL